MCGLWGAFCMSCAVRKGRLLMLVRRRLSRRYWAFLYRRFRNLRWIRGLVWRIWRTFSPAAWNVSKNSDRLSAKSSPSPVWSNGPKSATFPSASANPPTAPPSATASTPSKETPPPTPPKPNSAPLATASSNAAKTASGCSAIWALMIVRGGSHKNLRDWCWESNWHMMRSLWWPGRITRRGGRVNKLWVWWRRGRKSNRR